MTQIRNEFRADVAQIRNNNNNQQLTDVAQIRNNNNNQQLTHATGTELGATHPDANSRTNRLSVNDALRNTPFVPPFSCEMPDSMANLLIQHSLYKLDDCKNVRKGHWPQPLRQANSRRMYLHGQIVAKASRMRQNGPFDHRKQAAAHELDLIRDNRSLYQFYDYLKEHDPSKKIREKRKRARN